MANKYLDENGLLYFWGKVKTYVSGALPTKTSELTNDSGFITSADIPAGVSPSSTTPKMNGTASTGSENSFARGDHIHPTDTSRAPLVSPEFTGTPKAPTATVGTNNTQIATTAFVTSAVATAVGGITGISYQVVASLPASGSAGVIYLVSHSHGSGDSYDEYIWINNSFEKIGNTDIDLSGYMLKTDMVAISNSEIDAIVVV